MEFDALCARVEDATLPEEVFGKLIGVDDPLSEVKRQYRIYSKVLHPDRNPDRRSDADRAFGQLAGLLEKAEKRIEGGIYGISESDQVGAFSISIGEREYVIRSVLSQGDLSTVYLGDRVGSVGSGKVVVKVIDDPADNDLMQNEIRSLRRLHENPGPQCQHLPVVLDRFRTEEGCQANVLGYLEEYFDIVALREMDRYRSGIPDQHIAWILARLLSVVGYAHSRGVIHGNIEPAHIMIRPRDHNVALIDWSYAITNQKHGGGFRAINEDFSPPEASTGKPPLPSSDLYSVGKSMIYALGGDVSTGRIPSSVHPKFSRFVQFLARESPIQRAQDAWEVHRQLSELRTEIWGRKRFLEFII